MKAHDPAPIAGLSEVASPALIVFPDRIERNIAKMISMVGGRTERLRPHLKTNKMVEVTQMLMDAGIRKFKCATPAELEMAARAGAEDLLLAYQPVGPVPGLLAALVERYPMVCFSTLVDCPEVVEALGAALATANQRIAVYLDVDCGMGRTGIQPGSDALAVIRRVQASTSIEFAGLHVYDGHIRAADLEERRFAVGRAFHKVMAFADQLRIAGLGDVDVIAGGTPTYPIHAVNERVECSPGTCVFWDRGYACGLPDMDFEWAACVCARVVSRPGEDLLCLDLGHKAISAENPIDKRVWFPALPDAAFVSQSEEHLVLRISPGARCPMGTLLLGIPWHVCPTVALYDGAVVVRGGAVVGCWAVTARNRSLQSV